MTRLRVDHSLNWKFIFWISAPQLRGSVKRRGPYKMSFKSVFMGVVAGGLMIGAASIAQAGPILGAVSISSPQGDNGGGIDLVNIINQSGLSAVYTSGVTDFDTFTAATTHFGLGGFTDTRNNGPQQFTFDLGASVSIDAIAIWNSTTTSPITSFQLFADDDDVFGNGTTSLLFGPTALGAAGPSQVFEFASINTRFIHIEGLSTLDPPDFYGLGEVAFRSSNSSQVPEPSTLAILSLGLVGLGFARRKKKTTRDPLK